MSRLNTPSIHIPYFRLIPPVTFQLMAMPPSSSSVPYGFTYDVFLSFRGPDTRQGFTGNLWKALRDRGIRTFMDDEELRKGEEITPSLVQAIEQSKIAIIVLSENYASSSFCLEELSKILDCVKEKGTTVWPVFYKVDPSTVRRLTGSYGEAMAKHEARSNDNTGRLKKWKYALQQVADLIGFHFKNGDGYEHKFIGKIVEQVSGEIKPTTLYVADYLVGLESPTQNVTSLLNVGCDDEVHMVGIHGIGGIGKTTLALAVHNLIAHQFEGSCFLEKVRENSEKNGLLYLQKILLSKIVREKKIELTSVNEGTSMIQQRLGQKKVLLILDDVDKLEQLQAIVGKPEWFGPGSRIIITTRDKHLLTCHKVKRAYEVKELNEKDAFQLLVWKAFKIDKVSSSYTNVLNRAVTYASGLPLALEVIGSHLFEKGIEEWESTLDQYESIPKKEIQKIIRESFNALEEEVKSVFLDIACGFKGCELAMVEKILHAHYGVSKKYHTGVLVEKSLIKISESSNVILHDLIEDMGKEIVRKESLEEPGKRSRLWFPEDIVQVLEENTGTSKIEIIYLHSRIEVKWDGEAFKKMENLKTLIIRGGHFSKSPKHLPNSLRVLEWERYPSSGLPSKFYPKKLAICNLVSSHFTRGILFKKKFENMRVLNLDYCSFLTQIPNVSGLPNLEEFSFQCCENLITIHDSVGLLDKLKILNANGCRELTSFPPLKLTSLEQLHLSWCESLESFPPMVELLDKLKILSVDRCLQLRSFPPLKLASLEQLDLSYCVNLKSFPPMVDGLLGKLKILSFKGCVKLRSISPLKLASLEQLDLSFCDSLESFPHVVDGLLGKLKKLIADHCMKLRSFPSLKLPSLEQLDLSSCGSLESFPSLKLSSLEQLDLSNCRSLKSFPPMVDGLLNKLKILDVKGCTKLRSISPLKLASLEELYLSFCDSLESFPPVVDGLLDKLKILSANHCQKLRSFPPLKLGSLERLDLSYCGSLETFPPVVDGLLGKLKILKVRCCSKLKSIPPLMLASLEQLDLSLCDSLESFPPVVDGLLDKLKILDANRCQKLRSFPPLKLASLEELDISYCGSLETFPPVVEELLGKLKILRLNGCKMLRSIPPLKLASLELLDFSCCDSLESFPEILGEIENITWLYLNNTPIKELPFSFQNLTRLQRLSLTNCGIVQLPSSMVVMSKLVELTIKNGGWLFPKHDEGEEKLSPVHSSHVEFLHLRNCNLSYESLAIGLKWFANVKELYLSESRFTILPECIKKCHFLRKLVLDNCKELEEIKGIPPCLKTLSALNCKSLTSSTKSKLLNQELHDIGNTSFLLPQVEIPEWFNHQCMQGGSISFWFCNKFPAIALCVVSPSAWNDSQSHVRVIINGNTFFYRHGENNNILPEMFHLHLFHMQMENFNDKLDKALLENKWNHVEVVFELPFQKSGIHILKEKSSMKDIRFPNPVCEDVSIELIYSSKRNSESLLSSIESDLDRREWDQLYQL